MKERKMERYADASTRKDRWKEIEKKKIVDRNRYRSIMKNRESTQPLRKKRKKERTKRKKRSSWRTIKRGRKKRMNDRAAGIWEMHTRFFLQSTKSTYRFLDLRRARIFSVSLSHHSVANALLWRNRMKKTRTKGWLREREEKFQDVLSYN